MNQSPAPAVQERPPSRFEIACHVAGVSPPRKADEARALANRCVEGAKTKAGLLLKAVARQMPRAKALELVAELLTFPTWHAMAQFAKSFAELSAEERTTHPYSPSLLAGAWVLRPDHAELAPVSSLLAHQRVVLMSEGLASEA